MNNYKCPYVEMKVEGAKTYLYCKLSNSYCVFVRYCPTTKKLEHTADAPKCKLLKEKVGN